MQRNANGLIGYMMGATDGPVGKVEEFYFDDQSWTVRYLVVKTGSWLFGRKVLISPQAIPEVHWESGIIPVNLSIEQIRHSPDIDTEKPVSRQQEIQLFEHYPWLNYWGSSFYPGGDSIISNPNLLPIADDGKVQKEPDDETANQGSGDPHLRSSHNLTGYRMNAKDGEIGYVDDFIIDDQSWKIAFLVVDTRKWLSGRKVLISPKWITSVDWENSLVAADLSVATVKDSPEFDPHRSDRS